MKLERRRDLDLAKMVSAARGARFRSDAGRRAYFAAYDATLRSWGTARIERDISTQFGATHVIEAGPKDGAPLVLLPGNFVSATSWGPCAEVLTRSSRIYAIDLPGDLGRSGSNSPPRSRNEQVTWLGEVEDGLGVGTADLAGLSYGGYLAAALAVDSPNRVRRLVLVNPGLPLLGRPSGRWLWNGLLMSLFPSRMTAQRFWNVVSEKGVDLSDPVVDQWILGITTCHLPAPVRPVLRPTELGRLLIPTLVLMGDGNAQYGSEAARRLLTELAPRLRIMIVPNAGHALIADQPGPVASAMRAFLSD